MSALEKYAINYSELAQKGKLDPVIGRDDEIRRVIQILSRRSKNNPVLIGEPGVGKTAIVEGLALRVFNGDIPTSLSNSIIYSLDIGELLAGAKFKGEFEERLKEVLKEIKDSNGNIITFIDELHNIVGTGGGGGSIDLGNMLKPLLARGELRIIGATTLDEYRTGIEKDSALERRFQPIIVREPTVEDCITILRGLKERYEVFHNISIDDSALVAAAQLSDRYITSRFLPDKAIDLLDEAASRLRLEIDSVPTIIDILNRKIGKIKMEIISSHNEDGNHDLLKKLKNELNTLEEELQEKNKRWSNEKSLLNEVAELNKLLEETKIQSDKYIRDGDLEKAAKILYGTIPDLEARFNTKKEILDNTDLMISKVVGEEEIKQIVSAWCNIPLKKLGENDFKFLKGLKERLKDLIIGQDKVIDLVANTIIRSKSGLASKERPLGIFLSIGPTGVGKTELVKVLADELFNSQRNIVRVDMSEYSEKHTVSRLFGAPPGYIGYEEGGELTEAIRRNPYSVILFDEIEKAHPSILDSLLQLFDEGRMTDGLGNLVNFKNTLIFMTSNLGAELFLEGANNSNLPPEGLEDILSIAFKPEFLNRIDNILYFNPLSTFSIDRIALKEIEKVKEILRESHQIDLEFKDSALSWLNTNGFSAQYGARPLKRLLNTAVLDRLASLIVNQEIKTPCKVTFSSLHVADKELTISHSFG